jgi:hypothetical protein
MPNLDEMQDRNRNDLIHGPQVHFGHDFRDLDRKKGPFFEKAILFVFVFKNTQE